MNITVTLPDEDIARFEALARRLTSKTRGVTVTRAETIRVCAQHGLEFLELKEREISTELHANE